MLIVRSRVIMANAVGKIEGGGGSWLSSGVSELRWLRQFYRLVREGFLVVSCHRSSSLPARAHRRVFRWIRCALTLLRFLPFVLIPFNTDQSDPRRPRVHRTPSSLQHPPMTTAMTMTFRSERLPNLLYE